MPSINGFPIVNCTILILLFSISAYRINSHLLEKESPVKGKIFTEIEGTLWKYPYDRGSFQIIELKGTRIMAPLYPRYYPGDYIKVKGESVNGRMYYANISKKHENSIFVLNRIAFIKEAIVLRVRTEMPEPYAGLLLGMVIGYQESFTKDFDQVIKSAGISHVLVASGYNVSLLIKTFAFVTLRLGRLWYFTVNFLFISLYLLLVGFSAPIIRASIMGVLSIYARYMGEVNDSFYSLFLAGGLMLMFSPAFWTDFGFRLSFVATFGVILGSKIFSGLKLHIQEFLVVPFVTLFMSPYLLHTFQVYYFGSMVSNIVLSPLFGVLTIIGAIYIVLPVMIIKIPLVACYLFIVKVLEWASTFPAIGSQVNPIVTVLIYLIVLLTVAPIVFGRERE